MSAGDDVNLVTWRQRLRQVRRIPNTNHRTIQIEDVLGHFLTAARGENLIATYGPINIGQESLVGSRRIHTWHDDHLRVNVPQDDQA